MRVAAVLVSIALTGSFGRAALADEPAAPAAPPATATTPAPAKPATKLGLRVVRVMPESHQALLFDKSHNTHVLVSEGGTIEGYTVSEIDDETVTLVRDGAEVLLSAPYRRRAADSADAPKPAAHTQAKPATPEDPYAGDAAPPKPGIKAPEDPYAEPPPTTTTAIRTVEAPKPVQPGDGGVRVVESPDAAPTPVPATPAPTAVATGDLALTRAAFRAELADFGKLANGIKASFVAEGAKVDAVTAGSLFARAGLKANDLVLAVNGQPLHSIDDAAELYAHASSVKAIAIDVRRAGKSVTLHVTIQ